MDSTRTLASWRKDHGFGILCIVTAEGEHFLVETNPGSGPDGLGTWARMSDREMREHIAARGFSPADSDDAVQLSRQWKTTVTRRSPLDKSIAR
jgi:hypothetical protein